MVEAFDSTISGGTIQEEVVIDRWKKVCITKNYEPIHEINSLLCKRVAPGVEIVGIQPGSVRCYLLCRTPAALKTLYKTLENGCLNTTLQSIFNLLLGGEDTVRVEQTKGRLSASELQRRVEIFTNDTGMYLYYQVTRLLLSLGNCTLWSKKIHQFFYLNLSCSD